MNSHLKLDYLLDPGQLAFLIFLASGTFIILVYAPLFLWHQLSLLTIVFIYLFPWVMLWPIYSFDVIKSRVYRVEIIFIGTILILATANVILSDDIYKSFYSMRLFLLSGILPFWTSMFLLSEQGHRNKFYCFCCYSLAIVVIIQLISYFNSNQTFIFIYNPIPIGTLVILLSSGPLYLITSRSKKLIIIGSILIMLGLFFIITTQKRGSILAVAVMGMAWVFRRYVKSAFSALVVLLAIALIVPLGWKIWQSLDKNIPSHYSILHRLELYPFASHMFKKHPLFGTGLQSYSHHEYLKDYQQSNGELDIFPSEVRRLQKLENMFLTAFVEFGAIMALVYLGMIIYIIMKYCLNTSPCSSEHKNEFILLLPLLGLLVHSLTYDSLLWPQVNWLFHVQLGILAGYRKTN